MHSSYCSNSGMHGFAVQCVQTNPDITDIQHIIIILLSALPALKHHYTMNNLISEGSCFFFFVKNKQYNTVDESF